MPMEGRALGGRRRVAALGRQELPDREGGRNCARRTGTATAPYQVDVGGRQHAVVADGKAFGDGQVVDGGLVADEADEQRVGKALMGHRDNGAAKERGSEVDGVAVQDRDALCGGG